MDPSQSVQADIDETLRASRDTIERKIGLYRVFIYGACVLLTLVLRLFYSAGQQDNAPFLHYLFFAALSVPMYIAARRSHGGRLWNAWLSIIVDLVAIGLAPFGFALVRALIGASPVGDPGRDFFFAAMLMGPAVLTTCQIHSLRNHPTFAVSVYLIAAAAFGVDAWAMMRVPPERLREYLAHGMVVAVLPPAVVCTAIICMTGLVARASAIDSRKRLIHFAKLSVLKRLVPSAAVERISLETGRTTFEGRASTVTMMSTDLRGFTAMSERLTPTEVVEQLNAYHGAMLAVIEDKGGELDKFIGDGALVVFGLDTASSDAGAGAAVECATAMIEQLTLHNRERERLGRAPLAMGIGIHTGEVISGLIGAGRRMEFTVIGDAVNTAARLEGMTKETKEPILISVETAKRLHPPKALRELGALPLRGKSEPMKVFTPVLR